MRKTFLYILLLLNLHCKHSSENKSQNSINAAGFNQNDRIVKLVFSPYLWKNDNVPGQEYLLNTFKIDNSEFKAIKDTVLLNLPFQEVDTLFIKKDGKWKQDRLLKFKNGVTYEVHMNDCSGIEYFKPLNNNYKNTDFATVSFTIKNYFGKDSLIGVNGFHPDADDFIFLKNNIKTPYERINIQSAMCGTDPKRIAIEKYKSNVITEFWFQDIHAEKLDVVYDFKTNKTSLSVK